MCELPSDRRIQNGNAGDPLQTQHLLQTLLLLFLQQQGLQLVHVRLAVVEHIPLDGLEDVPVVIVAVEVAPDLEEVVEWGAAGRHGRTAHACMTFSDSQCT